MSKILKSVTALLGLWLIIEISVFSSGVALAIAFATAIAITAVASADAIGEFVKARRVSTSVATAALGAFLIIASLVFEGASTGWLMAIAGGAVEAFALTGLAVHRLRVRVVSVPQAPRAADPRLAA